MRACWLHSCEPNSSLIHASDAAAIPATVVAAASFDDMIAITGYTIFIDIAVTVQGNKGWAIAHGPLSVIFGVLAGLLAAYCCAWTKLWNNKLKRTAVVLLSSLFMKFIFDKYGFTSGGGLGSLTLGLCVKELWARGQPELVAIPETNHEFSRSVSDDTSLKCSASLHNLYKIPVKFAIKPTQPKEACLAKLLHEHQGPKSCCHEQVCMFESRRCLSFVCCLTGAQQLGGVSTKKAKPTLQPSQASCIAYLHDPAVTSTVVTVSHYVWPCSTKCVLYTCAEYTCYVQPTQTQHALRCYTPATRQ